MKYLALLSFLLLTSCSENLECDDPIFRSLFINITDIDGNNLIDIGVIISDDIKVRLNDQEYSNVVFSDIGDINNLVVINLGGPEENLSYEIQLSQSRLDTLVLKQNRIEVADPCTVAFWTLDIASYNGIDIPIEDFNGDFLITMVLE